MGNLFWFYVIDNIPVRGLTATDGLLWSSGELYKITSEIHPTPARALPGH